MIQLTNIDVFNFNGALRGMRNAHESWDKSDSYPVYDDKNGFRYIIGPKDLVLAQKLVLAGTDHSKFMRQIFVCMDIKAPIYWWKEFDTYKVGTVANSTSTMHKIHSREITINDFSHEHLYHDKKGESTAFLIHLIDGLNLYRKKFIEEGNKKDWWQLIQLLPSSYNQLRTVTLNYQVLRNMYFARRYHKLDEWREFCKEIEKLPYAKELICIKGE